MIVDKKATRGSRDRRLVLPFPRARDAFQAYLEEAVGAEHPVVLLPSYVGWSPREGSGVIDPILAARGRPVFYGLDARLDIDLDDLRRALTSERPDAVVAIHYFGRPDPNLSEVAGMCREHGALLMEDEAHAMLSDLVGGICGRAGDSALFSLHKILPFESGGALVLNGEPEDRLVEALERSRLAAAPAQRWWDYDLAGIAGRRRANQEILVRETAGLAGLARPLWESLPEGVVPQSFPVVLERGNRDLVYEEMNAAGFGVVTLYHTLVEEIPRDSFLESHALSRRILNLPLHQDVDPEKLPELVSALRRILEAS